MGSLVNRLIPVAIVGDVDRSIRFYLQLGFDMKSNWKKDDGTMQWAHLKSGFYMEKGEMQVDDPDGYCLLIGQCD